jgi:predicted DNA-binding antitoxin AbrB/MazE fold protein
MAKSIKALYENGVFKPLAKVRLRNKQKVKLTVVETEKSAKKARAKARRTPIADGRGITSHPAYRIVGLFKSGTHDLSANHDAYLYR